MTYNSPTMKMLVMPTFLRVGICKFQMIGTGMNMMTKSVNTSVAVKAVSMLSVLLHCVKKRVMGAQFQDQCVPHWNKVAKKKAADHAMMIHIITRQLNIKESIFIYLNVDCILVI